MLQILTTAGRLILLADRNCVEELPYFVGAPNTLKIVLLFYFSLEIRWHQENFRASLSKGSQQGIVLELTLNDGVDSPRLQPCIETSADCRILPGLPAWVAVD